MDVNFTGRMKRILATAEKEVQVTGSNALLPIHLLIASLQEKSGALGEIFLKGDFDLNYLRANLGDSLNSIELRPFNVPVTAETQKVMETAEGNMKRYKQIYINEGHLLKALIVTGAVDSFLTEENKNLILTLGTTARDMIAYLGANHFSEKLQAGRIRRVTQSDLQQLSDFVTENFSAEWAETVKGGFSKEEPSIYIALDGEENIIGFAAYDVYQNKKCYFGPMGVATAKRTKGIGYSLLHHCLKDMKEIGYEYAVIGGVGPIEFYEKACGAVVIPVNGGNI